MLCEEWRSQVGDLERGALQATSRIYAALLRQCASLRDLAYGSRIHRLMISTGHARHLFLGNLLIQMYSKCGSLDLAREVFDALPVKNEFSCSILISGYVQCSREADGIDVFHRMPRLGIRPDGFVYATVLSACSSLGDLAEGKAVHDQVRSSLFRDDSIVQNALVDLYAKCGRLKDARMVFEAMSDANRDHSAWPWTALMSGYAQHGQPEEAIVIFYRMELEGVAPDAFTFSSVLAACASARNLRLGKSMHSRVDLRDLNDDAIRSSLINMYGRCGSVADARSFFIEIASSASAWCWNLMISAYAQNGYLSEAMGVFYQMVLEGVRPVNATFVVVLSVCSTLEQGEKINARILETGYRGKDLDAGLVRMYAGLGQIDRAGRVFKTIGDKSVECWASLIAANVRVGFRSRALELYREWRLENSTDEDPATMIFIAALGACSSLDEILEIETHINRTKDWSSFNDLGATLLNTYARCGSVEDSRRVFGSLRSPDTVCWNAMLGTYAQHGHSQDAIATYHRMVLEGTVADSFTFSRVLGACSDCRDVKLGRLIHQTAVARDGANVVVKNAAIHLYARCDRLDEARRVFDGMGDERDPVSWSSMISGYARAGHPCRALELYCEMSDAELATVAEATTFASVLEACLSSVAEMEVAKAVHRRFAAAGLKSEIADTALVTMLGRSGLVDDARAVFESSKISHKDPVAWNAIIAAYTQSGYIAEAIALFRRMSLEGCSCGAVTFVSIIIACSAAGSAQESVHHFVSMSSDHGIAPLVEHFVCVVDALGRAGRLEEAEVLVESMPVDPRRKSGAWRSLLAAYQIHGATGETIERIECRWRSSCGDDDGDADEPLVLGMLWRSIISVTKHESTQV